MLRNGDSIYPFATERYVPEKKENNKLNIAGNMIKRLPELGQKIYFLIDSWYALKSMFDTNAQKGCYVIAGLKTNRIFYPQGIKQSLTKFAAYIQKSDTDVVTIKNGHYMVYRYEGKLINNIDNAVVLLSLEDVKGFDPAKMRAFISTDITLSNEKILNYYEKRWSIETYFRTVKINLSLDRYQVRSTMSLDRYFSLILFVSMLCVYIG